MRWSIALLFCVVGCARESSVPTEEPPPPRPTDISARDFIENVASRSSLSGEPGLLRINGTEMKARDWLLERLKEIEHP